MKMESTYYFKGRKKRDGKWIYGNLSVGIYGRHYISYPHEDNIVQLEVEENTVCQSTGIEDEYGRWIFFKDLVECRKLYENRITEDNKPMIGVVVYEYGQYYILFKDGTATEFDKTDTYNVICNVEEEGMEEYKELFESWKKLVSN